MAGWISLHRQVTEHWLYTEERIFSRYEAWIDLLFMASFKDTKFVLGNEVIQLKKGEFVTSELKLAEKWKWSKGKVRAFLKLLENEGMILKKTDKKKTTINVVNWVVYQDTQTTERPQTNHEKTTDEPQKDTINKGNKENNVNKENNTNPPTPLAGECEGGDTHKPKNKPKTKPKTNPTPKTQYAEFVSMTNDEYTSLVAKLTEQGATRCIEILDNYKGSKGKAYKSDYRAILSWVITRYEEEQAKLQLNKQPAQNGQSYNAGRKETVNEGNNRLINKLLRSEKNIEGDIFDENGTTSIIEFNSD